MAIIIMMPNSNPICQNEQLVSETGSRQNGRWTKEEHLRFIEGIKLFGKNWKRIESVVKTRSGSQIRSHAQKFFSKSSFPQERTGYSDISIQTRRIIMGSGGSVQTESPYVGADQLQNYYCLPLNPYTFAPTNVSDFSKPWRTLLPHQIWQESNEIMKSAFIQTYVEIQERVQPEQKENHHPIRKSSFTRCE